MSEVAPKPKAIISGPAPEAVPNYVEPTPLDQLIPGIDLSKLSSPEAMEKLHAEARKESAFGSTTIGRAQGDTMFFRGFMWGLGGYTLTKEGASHKAESKKEALDLLREKFAGKVIVDIGPGEENYGYIFAKAIGAKAYIAVDPFYGGYLRHRIAGLGERFGRAQGDVRDALVRQLTDVGASQAEIEERELLKNMTPWNAVEDDALAFLRALPEGSVCVIMSGISENVIPGNHLEKITEEIGRVLDPQGAFLSISSQIPKSSKLTTEVAFETKGSYATNLEGALYVRSKE